MNHSYELITPYLQTALARKVTCRIQRGSASCFAPLLCILLFSSMLVNAQTTYDWLDTAPDANWRQGAGGARWNPGGLWDEPPYGIIRFNNNHQLNMTNNVGGTYSQHQIIFGSSNTSSRTISSGTIRLFDFNGNDPKIENLSPGSHTINTNLEADGDAADPLELNPVFGDLTFGSTINNQGSDLLIYGDNGHTIRFDDIISGGGKFIIQQYSIVIFDAINTYSGNTEIDEGELWIDTNGDISVSSSILLGNGGEMGNFTKFFLADDNGGLDFTRNITVNNGNPDTRTIGTINTSGTNTFSGNVTSTASAVLRLEVPNANGTMDMAGQISGVSNELRKIGQGKVIFSGNHTYTGNTSVIAGTLELGAADRIADGSRLILAGGTFSTGQTNGFSETLATLQVTANSTIALGTGSHTLTFATSNAVAWTGGQTLTITGWQGSTGNSGTQGRIFVGNGISTLTPTQLAAISFQGFSGPAMLLPTGELVPGYTHNWLGGISSEWHNAANWAEGTIPTNTSLVFVPSGTTHSPSISSHADVLSLTIASGASINMTGSSTLTVANSGRIENNGTFLATNGTVIFNGSGTVLGSMTFNDITLNGGVSLSASINISGQLLINTNGAVLDHAPTYDAGSTLIYNSGNTYIANTEWTANAATGQGVPHHVRLGNGNANSELQFNTSGFYQAKGNVTIGTPSGSGYLMRLQNADLRLEGDYLFSNGSINNNGKAVFFVGSSDQDVSTDAAEVFFDYLIINKPSGNVVLQDPVTINTTSGEVLQLLNTGGLDLNGHRLRLNNDGGNILTNGAGRTILSSVAGGEVYVDGNKTVTQTNGGTLIFGQNITVEISSTVFTSINFGANTATINGQLIINAGGFVDTNAPIYGPEATLIYRGNATFNSGIELSSSLRNVVIETGIVLNAGGITSATDINGDLNIQNSAALEMGNTPHAITVKGNLTNAGSITLSTAVGGDLDVEGNWNSTGSFTSNGRALFFTGTTQQIIQGSALAADFLILDNPEGISLSENLTVSQGLTMTQGNIITGANTITLGESNTNPGTLTHTAGLVIGTMRRYFANATNTGSASGLFPLGSSNGDNRYALVEYTAAPTDGGYLTSQIIQSDMGLEGLKDATTGDYQIHVAEVGNCDTFTLRSTADMYWSIDDDDSLSGGTYTLTLHMENPTRVTSTCQLRLLKRVGTGDWAAPGAHQEPTGTVGEPVISATGITGWSNFGFGGDGPDNNPLPVSLLFFEGSPSPDGAKLSWQVSEAIGFGGFVVEKRQSDATFSALTFISYQSGQSHYQFTDRSLKGTEYYRLRLIDANGDFDLSSVISVTQEEKQQAFMLYPSTGDGQFQIEASTSAHIDLTILDLQGRQLGQWSADTHHASRAASHYLSSQKAGLYLIKVQHLDRVYHWKYIKY